MEDNIRLAQSFKPLSADVRKRAIVGQGVSPAIPWSIWKKEPDPA
jgi:hypothetical protein